MHQWRKYVYLTKAEAKAMGLTHEGTLYGLPVYLGDIDNSEEFLALPKVPILVVWTLLCTRLFELFATFLPDDKEVRIPMVLGDEL